jgi:hypothetical protein
LPGIKNYCWWPNGCSWNWKEDFKRLTFAAFAAVGRRPTL